MPSRRTFIAVGIGLALVVGLFVRSGRREPDLEWRLSRVEVGPLRRAVVASGHLVSRDSQRGSPPFNTTLTWIAPEGQAVKKGDVVARFNIAKQRERLRTKEVERDIARLERDLRGTELELEGAEVHSRVATLEQDHTVARIAHEQATRGMDIVRQVELSRLVESNALLIAALERSVAEMAPYVDRGFLSKDEQDRQQVRLASQRILGRALVLDRLVVEAGTTRDKRAQTQRDLVVAELNLSQARSRLAGWQHRKTEGFADADEKLTALETDLAELAATARKEQLRADRDGVVGYEMIYTGGSSRSRPVAGSTLYPGMAFLRVATAGALEVDLKVPEASASLIRGDELCRVEVAVGPPRSARVRAVGSALAGGMRAKYYFPTPHHLKVKVGLDDVTDLRAGMSATGHIEVESRPRVLWVSAAAVVGDAVVLADGSTRSIRTGAVSGARVEVLEGLGEGDSVRVPQPPVSRGPEKPNWQPVESGTFTLSLTESGTIEPCLSRNVSLGEVEGDSVPVQELASDGTMVKTSDVLIQLDSSTLDAKVQERELQVAVAAKEEEVAREKATAEVLGLEKDCEVALKDERAAQLADQMVREGEPRRKLVDLTHDMALASADVDLLSRKLKLKEALTGKGYVSAEEVKQLRLDLYSRQVSLVVAQVRYELSSGGATPLERQKSAASLARHRLARELLQKKLTLKRRLRDGQLAKAGLALSRARLTLERTKSMQSSFTVRAPGGGMVMVQEGWQSDGERKLRVGDTVQSYQVVMSLADTSRFQVTGVIPEERIGHVKVGQRARFWLTADKSIEYPATVESVGAVAHDVSSSMSWLDRSSARRCFDVVLSTAARPPKFKPGLSVRFDIELATSPGALIIPVQALHFDQGGAFVWTAGGRRAVSVGEECGGRVQVLRGLSAAEVIHVRP